MGIGRMSIVLGEIGGTRLVGVIGCFLACTAPEITGVSPEVKECLPVEVDEHCISSIGSNSVVALSIGSNTSNRVDSESDGEGSQEAESRLKWPLETMNALEEALPFRQGISRFLSGKSKKPTNSNHSTSSVNNYASSTGSNSSNSEGKQQSFQLPIPCYHTGSLTDTSPISPLLETLTSSSKSFSRTNLPACSSPIPWQKNHS